MTDFILDIAQIRTQAARCTEDGALTKANTVDHDKVITLLQGALATEWICVLRYSQHAAAATGIHAATVSKHFTEHAEEEWQHANMLSTRIKQLGGQPHLEPTHLAQTAHSYYKECASLAEMIQENLLAERIAIISYTEMIRFVGENDPTTRRVLEQILGVEEEHADELADLLKTFDPREPVH